MSRTPGAKDFTPEEIERCLTALALVGGNTSRALELLADDDVIQRVPDNTTLQLWKTKHAEKYREIRDQRAPQIEAAAVHDYRAILAATNQAHLALVQRAADRIDDLNGKDAAAAAKNLAIAGGVAADKLLVFTDRPNVIHSKPDPEHLVTRLQAAFGLKPPETITDAQVIEEPASPALIDENQPSNARELAA